MHQEQNSSEHNCRLYCDTLKAIRSLKMCWTMSGILFSYWSERFKKSNQNLSMFTYPKTSGFYIILSAAPSQGATGFSKVYFNKRLLCNKDMNKNINCCEYFFMSWNLFLSVITSFSVFSSFLHTEISIDNSVAVKKKDLLCIQ